MPATFKHFLERLVTEKAPGPPPSFSAFHLLLALDLLAKKSIGRKKLAEELDVGEGVTRTMIGRLEDAGLVVTSKAGCSLTEKGTSLWREYESTLRKVEIGKNELTFGGCSYAILIKKRAHMVKSGIEQRDAAVMAGAKGATTLLCKKGHLVFPSTSMDLVQRFPKASKQISMLLESKENDVIIIASSDSRRKAEYGALAAAWTILDDE
jgi:predicted transcriptional regulator